MSNPPRCPDRAPRGRGRGHLWGLALALIGLVGPAQARLLPTRSATRPASSEPDFRTQYRMARGYPFQAALAVELPLKLRLGIMSGQHRVRFRTAKAATIRVGDRTIPSPAGSRWSVVHKTGTAATIRSRALLARVPFPARAEAERLRQAWESRGHEARIFPMGVLLEDRRSGRLLNDSRCWFVTLGPEVSWTAAWNRCIELTAQGVNPTVFEEMVTPPQGTMTLVDGRGRVRARGPSVQVRSGGDIKVYRVEHDKDLPQHGFEDRVYRGNLSVDVGRYGKLAVSTSLDIETYLKGVVPSEIYASDPLETIKAQAVAARSETLSGLGFSNPADPWDICSDQHCQAYRGHDRRSPRTDAGVEATRFQVLRYGDTVLNAVYCDTCGGHTENLEKVWSLPPHPAMKGRPDLKTGSPDRDLDLDTSTRRLARFLGTRTPAWCSRSKTGDGRHFRWSESRSVLELTRTVNRRYKVGRVKELIPVERGVSGRLRRLKVIGTEGEVVIFKELAIRQAMGGLKSAMFLIEPQRDGLGNAMGFEFKGGGWGHGVGLCQSGARQRAEAGQDYRTILGHYYRGATIETLLGY